MKRPQTGGCAAGFRVGLVPMLMGVLLAAHSLSGCSPDSAGAAGAAQDFRRAVAGGDPSTACSMLSPHTREEAAAESNCEDELPLLDLPADGAVLRTESYGRNAMVVFEDDTLFLSVSGTGWQVTGAGCVQRGESPYDCEVGG